jgi:bacteriorhodopsin
MASVPGSGKIEIPTKGEKDSPENIAKIVGTDQLTKSSFYFTYGLLLTTATITFIEALRNSIPAVRHIMNLETCISLVAGYFYSSFITTLQKSEESSPGNPTPTATYEAINTTRFTDWSITTPLMLLAFMLALQYNKSKSGAESGIPILFFIGIILLNFSMLGSGYAADRKWISKRDGSVFGFLFFFIMFGLIYGNFVMNVSGPARSFNLALFSSVFILWSIYGGVYWVEDEATKNTAYNILDLTSKCFIGIFLWTYFTGILV